MNKAIYNLPAEVKKGLCQMINSYGSGQHPWANYESLPYFEIPYIMGCIDMAINDPDAADRKEEALAIKQRVSGI